MQEIFRNAIASLKQNIRPGIVLWLVAISLVLLYYFYEPSEQYFDFLGDLKEKYGLAYAIISTAFFGGLIPFVYLVFTKKIKTNYAPELLFYLLFWAWKGAEVDFLYTCQSIWFGTETNLPVILKKTVVDQFFYSAFWAAPSITVFYLWKSSCFRFSVLKKEMNARFFKIQIPTVIISNWLIWIPAVSIIYTLPLQLQVPLFNIVLCFWVLLLAILNNNEVK